MVIPEKTALILIGYQNEYFSPEGSLHSAIEESAQETGLLANTLDLIERLLPTPVTIISTPIIFTPDYSELVNPVGILKTIWEKGAFRAGTSGSAMIPELQRFGDRILEVPGKRGLNAFSNTKLDAILQQRGIDHVVLAGVVTSICIDSTGRSASDRGYRVTILSDCTSGRTNLEQRFYCEQIFPLYGEVMTHTQLLSRLEKRNANYA